MIDELQLFRGGDYVVSESLTIRQPTINEICDYGEQKYYNMVSVLCSTPSDLKVQLLDDFGIDYESISEFELFCWLSHSFQIEETAIIFGCLNFPALNIAQNTQTEEIVLQDAEGNVVIDRAIYLTIVGFLRSIHGFERHVDKPANEHTKKYMIEVERRRQQRHRKDDTKSLLVPLVSSMVNCEQFKYNHETVWNLQIYPFMDSVRRIQKLRNYNQVMQGVYAGTIDLKTISEDSINWMGSLGG